MSKKTELRRGLSKHLTIPIEPPKPKPVIPARLARNPELQKNLQVHLDIREGLIPMGWVRTHRPPEDIIWYISTESGMDDFQLHPTYKKPTGEIVTYYTYANGETEEITGATLQDIYNIFYEEYPEETEVGVGFKGLPKN